MIHYSKRTERGLPVLPSFRRLRGARARSALDKQGPLAPTRQDDGLPFPHVRRTAPLADRGADSPDLTQVRHEFADWTVEVPFKDGALKLLCCPEDRQCPRTCENTTRVCHACEFPVCMECRGGIIPNANMPAAAITNDMMVFYLPMGAECGRSYNDGIMERTLRLRKRNSRNTFY